MKSILGLVVLFVASGALADVSKVDILDAMKRAEFVPAATNSSNCPLGKIEVDGSQLYVYSKKQGSLFMGAAMQFLLKNESSTLQTIKLQPNQVPMDCSITGKNSVDKEDGSLTLIGERIESCMPQNTTGVAPTMTDGKSTLMAYQDGIGDETLVMRTVVEVDGLLKERCDYTAPFPQ